jgi:hypothetical protein
MRTLAVSHNPDGRVDWIRVVLAHALVGVLAVAIAFVVRVAPAGRVRQARSRAHAARRVDPD